MPGAMIGETFGTIIAHQFEALRDGDQFYYEKALDPAELAMVKNTSLSDIIERDTDTDVMQADAFLTADRHASDVKAADPNAPQLIIGTTARDNIQGGQADDTLVVSGNVQNVTGGGGNDTFVFDFGQSTTTVVHDFHAGDLLEIHGVDPTINFSAVHVTFEPGDDARRYRPGPHQAARGRSRQRQRFSIPRLTAHEGRAGQQGNAALSSTVRMFTSATATGSSRSSG